MFDVFDLVVIFRAASASSVNLIRFTFLKLIYEFLVGEVSVVKIIYVGDQSVW